MHRLTIMTGRLDPPDGYDPERREIWTQTVNRLTANGRVFTANPDILDTYVQAIYAHRKATEFVNQTPPLVIRGEHATENPAYTAQRRSAETIARLGHALGLNRDHRISGPATTTPTSAPRWCDQHKRHECTKHRRRCDCPSTKVPPGPEGCCHQQPVTGTDACRHHSGKSLAQARRDGQVALARVYGAPVEVTPVQGLLDEVRWSAGHVAALRGLVLALESGETTPEGDQTRSDQDTPGGLWWGTARRVRRPDGDEVTEVAGQHVILQAYNAERRHFLEACRAAVSAGAQQELVDQAKLVGSQIGRLLDAVFEELVLNEEQKQRLPAVMPRVLRNFELGGTG